MIREREVYPVRGQKRGTWWWSGPVELPLGRDLSVATPDRLARAAAAGRRSVLCTIFCGILCFVLGTGLTLAGATTPEAGRTGATQQNTGTQAKTSPFLVVTDFLPPNHVRDGSVSYQASLQRALDAAAESGRPVLFPPMTYLLNDPAGLRLRSGLTLSMYGAKFVLSDSMDRDGQAFLGENVTDITMLGGEVVGRRDSWPDGVNIAGVRIRGSSARIRIRDMHFRDLSSNGIGIFGEGPENMASDVWITNTMIRRCSNKYIDYLLPGTGPARGSERTDQGNVAFYYVRNFVVRDCVLENSQSDGTHFYRCSMGRFVGNIVSGSTMGGYFVETSDSILAADNIIRNNGSRGVTIEAGSRYCTLRGNLIEGSGREGLWAPDSIGLVVTENIFRHNGRKDHGDLDGEIMINESGWDPPNTPRAEHYLISGNLFYTTDHQGAAIRVLPKCSDIVIKSNVFLGPVRTILVASSSPEVQRITVRDNVGAVVVEAAP